MYVVINLSSKAEILTFCMSLPFLKYRLICIMKECGLLSNMLFIRLLTSELSSQYAETIEYCQEGHTHL